MKKIFTLLSIFFLFFPDVAYANGAGLPSFFKINAVYSKPNPLQIYGIPSQSFLIPQDIAPENYVMNQPITFEIDQDKLETVIPPEMMKNTTFVWDYGDGSNKEEGLQHTHTYKKIGSYILILTINVTVDPQQQPTQFIDSYLLNILPNKNYRGLPQAVIKLNGQIVKSSIGSDPIKLNFKYPLSFDGSSSKSTSQITQYLWNFGDGQTSTKPALEHNYSQDQNASSYGYVVIVERVKDKNGFISDTFVGAINDPKSKNNTSSIPPKSSLPFFVNMKILLLGFFVGLLIMFLLKKLKVKK